MNYLSEDLWKRDLCPQHWAAAVFDTNGASEVRRMKFSFRPTKE